MSYLARLRAQLGHQPVILAYATALIRDEHGRLLFQRRGDFGWWGLPGGILELGETFAECCVREAAEETGYTVVPTRLVGVYSGPRYAVTYPNGDQVQQFTVALESGLTGGAGQVDGEEAREQAFFAPDAHPATSAWYTAMARDLLAGAEAASFEPPRADRPVTHGDTILALRQRVGAGWLIAPGASALVRDGAGQVLLVRRADNGRWMLPSGYMDLGESIAETVVRELREETGLEVRPERLINVSTGPQHQVTYPNGDQVQVCSTLFECAWVGGALRPDAREITAAEFFPPSALPEPLTGGTARRVALALEGRAAAFFS